ncbi:MAG: ABC transporter permease subunit [Paludibacter sp.]
MYIWSWDWVWTYKGQLLNAAWLTLWLNILILIIGSIMGLLLGILKRSKLKLLKLSAVIFIDLIRTLPALVLLIWFYFCVPILFQIKMNAILSSVIVLSINLSAFVAEIVDAGIEAVPGVHKDSATLLGLSKTQNLRYIILPIALRNMTPPLVGQYINSIKLSVLASVIAVPELLNTSQDIITQTYRPLEFYSVLALIFLIILLPGTIWSKRFELKQMFEKKENLK